MLRCQQRASGNPEVGPVITAAKLRARTVKDLVVMAKRKGVSGWHSMRKEQLVRALVRKARSQAAKAAGRNGSGGKKAKAERPSGKAAARKHRVDRPSPAAQKAHSPRSERRLRQIKNKLAQSKDLAFRSVVQNNGCTKDRLVVMVRDPYWLHAYWELTRASIERAEAAMGQHWHGARPVLRVFRVPRDGTTNSARKLVRDIPIHGGVNNWYVDVPDPPKSYQLDIGYLAPNEKYISIVKSNVVSTPRVGAPEAVDGNWAEVAEDFDRIYAMSGGYANKEENADLKELFEQRLRRPMGSPMVTRFGLGAGVMGRNRPEFSLEVDAELIVFGITNPDAHVTLKGEPVRLQEDGTFTLRFEMPERRQVLPVVACSGDGVEQRTIVLAVERNTKVMEPVFREPDA